MNFVIACTYDVCKYHTTCITINRNFYVRIIIIYFIIMFLNLPVLYAATASVEVIMHGSKANFSLSSAWCYMHMCLLNTQSTSEVQCTSTTH